MQEPALNQRTHRTAQGKAKLVARPVLGARSEARARHERRLQSTVEEHEIPGLKAKLEGAVLPNQRDLGTEKDLGGGDVHAEQHAEGIALSVGKVPIPDDGPVP